MKKLLKVNKKSLRTDSYTTFKYCCASTAQADYQHAGAI